MTLAKRMHGLKIRREKKSDIAAIRRVHQAAFGGLGEADLVDTLQADGDAALSLIAWYGGEVVGHILFSRMTAVENRNLRAVALAPLAVLPSHQRLGIGSTLVRDALDWLKSDGEDVVLVLGDSDFYGRFGFSAEAARKFATPYDGPHLQALALSDDGARAAGVLRYAPAFGALA
jgi:putative acetyltransferase